MVLVSIRSNTILDCVYDTVTTDIFSTVTSLDVTSSYHLYYLSQSVTWCQAYHFCDRRGRHLASIKDNAAQTTIQQVMFHCCIITVRNVERCSYRHAREAIINVVSEVIRDYIYTYECTLWGTCFKLHRLGDMA